MTTFATLRPAIQREMLARMPEHIARISWSRTQIAARQETELRNLVAHAQRHSPFHAQRLAHIDAQGLTVDRLAELPTMNKGEMMARLDDVFTDRRLTRALAEAALAATTTEPQVILDTYCAMATGGSSGQRGVFVFDRDALAEYYCALMRQHAKAAAGKPGQRRAAFVAAACPVHATAFSVPLTAGPEFPMQFTTVPATLPVIEIVAALNALAPQALFGYPSMLHRLAKEAEAGRLRIAVEIVSCTSETLGAEQRETLAHAFHAPVLDTFGSTEGLVGKTAPNDPVFAFNSDNCIVELVDDHDNPVRRGERSSKILLTNLTNRVQPLIRYEMSDWFVQCEDAPDHGHLRATVEGRSDELLHFGAADVHPLAVRSVMVKTPAVLDYQVTQTPSGIDVAAIAEAGLDVRALSDQLREALQHAGLAHPSVNVGVVPTLERHAQTGKLRRFIPLPVSAPTKKAS